MFKKSKKKLSVLLILAMVMTMLTGLAAPAAASTRLVVEAAVATHPSAATIQSRMPGRIDILRGVTHPVVTATDRTIVRITLPAGVTWDTVAGAIYTSPVATEISSQTLEDDSRTVVFSVYHTANVDSIRFTNRNINVPANFTGNIDATVALRGETTTGNYLWDQTSTVRVASIVTGGTTATAVYVLPVIKGAPNQAVGNIRIVELVPGSFINGTITLTAPAGVTFTGIPFVTSPGIGADTVQLVVPAISIVGGRSTVTANVYQVSGGITTVTFSNLTVNVDLTVADGPINIAVGGTAGVTAATVAPATVGVAGAVVPSAVYTAPLPTVNAGRLNESVATIRLTENLADAFAGNRVLTLTLPAGFTWNAITPNPPAWASEPAPSADGRTLTFWTVPNPATGPTFDLTGITINTHITAPAGDIVVTVGGNTGATGTVTVGTLRRPVTVTAVAAPDLRADSLDQPLGNLVITEAAAGALMAGNLTITLPAGVTVVGTPVVAATVATGGTLPTFAAVYGTGTNVITVPVATASATHPATVTISGLRVNLDRVPVGTPITATLAGAAILEAGITAGLANAVAVAPADAVTAVRGATVPGVALGNVISRTFTRSVFTIGALSYVRDGVSMPIDVTPTIVAGRTLLPLRFAALAVGVSEDNILWDPVRRTVIIIGDRVVQFQIGSTSMLINGIAVPLDVAPSIINGRTMLPIRALAQALRAEITWDGTARTATVIIR